MPVTDPHISGSGPYSITCTVCDPYVIVWGDTKVAVKKAYDAHCTEFHPA